MKPSKVNVDAKNNSFWKQIGMIVIGTTISLLLTIAAAKITDNIQRVKDRRLSAMMVMSNIEIFASNLNEHATVLEQIDSVATWLLSKPVEVGFMGLKLHYPLHVVAHAVELHGHAEKVELVQASHIAVEGFFRAWLQTLAHQLVVDTCGAFADDLLEGVRFLATEHQHVLANKLVHLVVAALVAHIDVHVV